MIEPYVPHNQNQHRQSLFQKKNHIAPLDRRHPQFIFGAAFRGIYEWKSAIRWPYDEIGLNFYHSFVQNTTFNQSCCFLQLSLPFPFNGKINQIRLKNQNDWYSNAENSAFTSIKIKFTDFPVVRCRCLDNSETFPQLQQINGNKRLRESFWEKSIREKVFERCWDLGDKLHIFEK